MSYKSNEELCQTCFACGKAFSFTNRKRQCRGCGRILHAQCCYEGRDIIPEGGGSLASTQLCQPCHNRIHSLRKPIADDMLSLQLATRATTLVFKGNLVDTDELSVIPRTRADFVRGAVLLKDTDSAAPEACDAYSSSSIVSRLVPLSYPPFSLDSDKKRATMLNSITMFKHPCIARVLSIVHVRDRNGLIVNRYAYKKGSLRDKLFSTPEKFRFLQRRHQPLTNYSLKQVSKTPSKVAVLSEKDVIFYSRHILEALSYFRFFGFPYPYLHLGNILLTDNACVITDFENIVAGIHPFYHSLLTGVNPAYHEIVTFGMVFYEMSTGSLVPSEGVPVAAAPAYAVPILKRIFPSGVVGGRITAVPEVTVEDLLTDQSGPFIAVKSKTLSRIKDSNAVFRGPITKNFAAYFKKLGPAVADIIAAHNAASSVSGSADTTSQTLTAVPPPAASPKKGKHHHKSSSSIPTSSPPPTLAAIIGRSGAISQPPSVENAPQRVSNDAPVASTGLKTNPASYAGSTTSSSSSSATSVPVAPVAVAAAPAPPPPPPPPPMGGAPPPPPPPPPAAAAPAAPMPAAQPGRNALLDAIRNASHSNLRHVK